ncbi:hypothetical protein DM01DRAFT_1409196 [Hesseltinella vesiculosa]|uniref:Cas12f1-like TNB domain-containing protein n=1 Tax=Hesseltinella vesiculosa TaxID=101127 RepID=A0A1X2GBW3_9FUNG|nr:hypothetical protein DM01DRAFT_1409196 [Hesseltinella vesiculosa]
MKEVDRLEKLGDEASLAAAEIRRRTAQTHSRASSHRCPSHKSTKRVLTKRKLGGTTRHHTLKHGLANLIKRPANNALDSTVPSTFISAVRSLASHNRDIVIHSHLFLRHFVTTLLRRRNDSLPPALFDQVFFTSVFQLLMGKAVTNTRTLSQELRADLTSAFATFRTEYGPPGNQPWCPPVASPVGRRPVTFSSALSSTAMQCAKDWKNHIVEGMSQCLVTFMSAKLLRLVPELKSGQARAYALYLYDRIAQDPKFEPELPDYTSMDSRLKEKVQSKFNLIINDCHALLEPAIRQIQEDLRERQALAEERRRKQTFEQASREATASTQPATTSSSHNTPTAPWIPLEPVASDDLDGDDDMMSLDTALSVSATTRFGGLNLQSVAASDSDVSSNAGSAPDDQPALGIADGDNNVMLTTATYAGWPHLFLPVMAKILGTLEMWNKADEEQPANNQKEASLSWVRHELSQIPGWAKLGHQKRTRLVSAIAKLINSQSARFDANKLPPAFDANSRTMVKDTVETAKQQLAQDCFKPPAYLFSPPCRMFALLPVPSFRLRYVRINASTMGTLLHHFGLHHLLPQSSSSNENQPGALDAPHKNFGLLDMTKFKNQGVFEDSLMSDGYAVSATFKKLKPVNQEAPLTLEDIDTDDLSECRVWGVDPGVGQVYVAVDGSDTSIYDNEGAMASDPRHEIRRYSSQEYFHDAGFHRTNQRIRDLKSQHGIDTLESAIPSPCTMDLSKLDLYTKAVLERAQLLKDFYAEHLPPLRFLNYRGRQKADGELVNIFLTGGNKYGRQSDRELVDLTVPEGNVSMQSPQEEQVDMDAYEHDGPLATATSESAPPLALSPVLSAPPHATSQPSVGTNPTSRATAIATARGAIAIAIAEGYAPSIRISIDNPQPQEPMQTGTRATTTLQQVTPAMPLISTQPSVQMGRGSATSIAASQNAIAIAIAGNRAPSINISSGSSTSQVSLPIENDNPSVSIIGTSSEPSVAVDVGDTAFALASTSPLFLQPMIDSSSHQHSETAPSPHAHQSFANDPDVLTNVNTPPPLPRQKWRKQEFVATPKSKVTLVCLGDGKFGRRSFRGHPSGLAARLKKLLQRADRDDRLVLLSTDEKWTSQVCSKCGRQGCKPIEIAGSNLHSVTVCQHCGQMWQRDCNAARNILSVARLAIEGASRPQVLSQKVADQDGDVQGAPNDPDPMDNLLLPLPPLYIMKMYKFRAFPISHPFGVRGETCRGSIGGDSNMVGGRI